MNLHESSEHEDSGESGDAETKTEFLPSRMNPMSRSPAHRRISPTRDKIPHEVGVGVGVEEEQEEMEEESEEEEEDEEEVDIRSPPRTLQPPIHKLPSRGYDSYDYYRGPIPYYHIHHPNYYNYPGYHHYQQHQHNAPTAPPSFSARAARPPPPSVTSSAPPSAPPSSSPTPVTSNSSSYSPVRIWRQHPLPPSSSRQPPPPPPPASSSYGHHCQHTHYGRDGVAPFPVPPDVRSYSNRSYSDGSTPTLPYSPHQRRTAAPSHHHHYDGGGRTPTDGGGRYHTPYRHRRLPPHVHGPPYTHTTPEQHRKHNNENDTNYSGAQTHPPNSHHPKVGKNHMTTPPSSAIATPSTTTTSATNITATDDSESYASSTKEENASQAVESTSEQQKPRAPSSISFPMKLHQILSSSEYEDYITWLPHGRAWRILKAKGFESIVIPKFFRSTRYASFMRQVNGWGFRRITEGPDVNAYYHEMFLRGLPHVCSKMKRPQKNSSTKDPSAPTECPDFTRINQFAPMPPLNNKDRDEDVTVEVVTEHHNNHRHYPHHFRGVPSTATTVVKEEDAGDAVDRSASFSSVSTSDQMTSPIKCGNRNPQHLPVTISGENENSPSHGGVGFPSLGSWDSTSDHQLQRTPISIKRTDFDIGSNGSSSGGGRNNSYPEERGSGMHPPLHHPYQQHYNGGSGYHRPYDYPSTRQQQHPPYLYHRSSSLAVSNNSLDSKFSHLKPSPPSSGSKSTKNSKLSEADLYYLAQQNKALLEQAHGRSNTNSSKTVTPAW